eukprot:5372205-Prymnesium_polylepis.1
MSSRQSFTVLLALACALALLGMQLQQTKISLDSFFAVQQEELTEVKEELKALANMVKRQREEDLTKQNLPDPHIKQNLPDLHTKQNLEIKDYKVFIRKVERKLERKLDFFSAALDRLQAAQDEQAAAAPAAVASANSTGR